MRKIEKFFSVNANSEAEQQEQEEVKNKGDENMNNLTPHNINKSELEYLRKSVGFEYRDDGKGGKKQVPTSDTALRALYIISKKYDLNPLENEISILFGRPFISYKGLKKILDKEMKEAGKEYQIDFRILKHTVEGAEVECRIYVLPNGYKRLSDYYKQMIDAGLTYEQAKQEMATTGYSKIYASSLNSKMKRFVLLMAKKQAFKDALNFLQLPSGENISVDFSEEYEEEEEKPKKTEAQSTVEVVEEEEETETPAPPEEEEEEDVDVKVEKLTILKKAILKNENIAQKIRDEVSKSTAEAGEYKRKFLQYIFGDNFVIEAIEEVTRLIKKNDKKAIAKINQFIG